MGLVYTTTSMLAEYHFAYAWKKSPDFYVLNSELRQANTLFPLEYRIRQAPIYNYVFNKPKDVPISEAIEATQKALRYDPYAANLHVALLKLYGDSGNLAGMRTEFVAVQSLVPQTPLIKELTEAGFK